MSAGFAMQGQLAVRHMPSPVSWVQVARYVRWLFALGFPDPLR